MRPRPHMSFPQPSTLTFRLSILLLAVLSFSCSRTALSSGSTGGGAGSGGSGGGTGGSGFTIADLNGDWTGSLLGDQTGDLARNFYLRFVDGLVADSAEGFGSRWSTDNARINVAFDAAGRLRATLRSDLTAGNITLEGQMDDAMVILSGTYTFTADDGTVTAGTWSVTRSTGPGHFAISLLEGLWDGEGVNERSKFRLATLEIDATGLLVEAEVRHPVTDAVVHRYSGGAVQFTLTDDAVGRMDDVLITGNDGSTLRFTYLLVNEDGTLISGPGFDSALGAGFAVIAR
ncbi:MAG: hypothetical protein ACPG31_11430 [Planctomycetota bacterium]